MLPLFKGKKTENTFPLKESTFPLKEGENIPPKSSPSLWEGEDIREFLQILPLPLGRGRI